VVKPKNNYKRIVVKFGGTSLSSGENVLRLAKAVADEARKGTELVVVVSAMGKSTDTLIETAKKASEGQVSAHELDDILSMGERSSARIFTAALKAQGVKTHYFDPVDPKWPIITNNRFNNADPIPEECDRRIQRQIVPLLDKKTIPVIPGFIGRSKDGGKITTMGRGGSDTTAFILARAIGAKEVLLVTDVDGIMSADPKLVKNPKLITSLTVDKLAGLADAGSKFIHTRALKHKEHSIDVRIVNYAKGKLSASGTTIKGALPSLEVELTPKPAMSITIVGEDLSEAPEVISKIVKEIRNYGSSVLGISTNRNSVILYVPLVENTKFFEKLHSIVLAYKKALAMAVKKNLAFIVIRGVGLEETPGVIGRISEPLHRNRINIFGIFTITSSVMVLVDWEDREKSVKLIEASLGD